MLRPGTLVGYTELGLSDLLPILVFGSVATSSKLKVFRTVLYLSDESSADVHLGCGGFIPITFVS